MNEPRNRRDFVRLTLGASAVALVSPDRLRADEPAKESKDKEKDKPDPIKAEADARMALVEARFGKHLDAEGRKAVRSEMEGIVRRAAELRKFELTNGDGPFPVFTPYRAPLA